MDTIKPIAISAGEPAGIGPDLVVELAGESRTQPWLAIANAEMLEQRAQTLGIELQLHRYQAGDSLCVEAGQLSVLDVPLAAAVEAGTLNADNSAYVLRCLELATDGCLNGDYSALVTAPVHKGVINESGIPFSGHTEFLAERCGADQVVMMLATEELRVALVTTHLPLADVAKAISARRLETVTQILERDLKKQFGIAQPHILVLGLNPHAGEGGHMGREEVEIIEPSLDRLRQLGLQLEGPLPADTAFNPDYLERADAVLAMYHDQGLPVLKYQGFGRAVNITLGLPIVRCSVDHGTALDLAGTGRAHSGSMRAALKMAEQMAAHHRA